MRCWGRVAFRMGSRVWRLSGQTVVRRRGFRLSGRSAYGVEAPKFGLFWYWVMGVCPPTSIPGAQSGVMCSARSGDVPVWGSCRVLT